MGQGGWGGVFLVAAGLNLVTLAKWLCSNRVVVVRSRLQIVEPFLPTFNEGQVRTWASDVQKAFGKILAATVTKNNSWVGSGGAAWGKIMCGNG